MKLSTAKKSKVLKLIDKTIGLLEKCGGEGGTPGPCPTGGGGDSKVGKKSKEAHNSSIEAHKFSMSHGDAATQKKSSEALQKSKAALDANGNQKLHMSASRAHVKAAYEHLRQSQERGKQLGAREGSLDVFPNDPAVKKHGEGYRLHQKAADDHTVASGKRSTTPKFGS